MSAMMTMQRIASQKSSARSRENVWSSLALALLCCFCPFIAVFLVEGGYSRHMCINIVLWLCGILPGIVHALTILFARRNLRVGHWRRRSVLRDVKIPFTGGSKYITIRTPRRARRKKKSKKRKLSLAHGEVVVLSRTPSNSTHSTSVPSAHAAGATTPWSVVEQVLGSDTMMFSGDHVMSEPIMTSPNRILPRRRTIQTHWGSPTEQDDIAALIARRNWMRRSRSLEVEGVSSEP